MDRSSTQKIKKETQVLNDTLDDLIGIFRTLHSNGEEHTLFSSAYGKSVHLISVIMVLPKVGHLQKDIQSKST